jgi:hypothetical protein
MITKSQAKRIRGHRNRTPQPLRYRLGQLFSVAPTDRIKIVSNTVTLSFFILSFILSPNPMNKFAAQSGKVCGIIFREAVKINAMIDWAEVFEIVLRGIVTFCVLMYLASKYIWKQWKALPGYSEKLGKLWASFVISERKFTVTTIMANLSTVLDTFRGSSMYRNIIKFVSEYSWRSPELI